MSLPLIAARFHQNLDNDAAALPTFQTYSIFERHGIIKALRIITMLMTICLALLPIQIAFSATSAEATDDDPGVELCYYADGPGREVTGLISGRPFSNHARVFRVTVDDTEQDAFCTDLYNPIGTKQCHSNSAIGVTDPKVACVLQNYSPGTIIDDDEAAAVQSAIWHFSDGFELSPDENIFGRYQSIVADVEAKYASGACTPIDNWQLSVEMEDGVHFLQPIGDGFRPDQHLIFIKLLASDTPVANQSLVVTTDMGNLSWSSERGSQITIQTDQDGTAVVAISHDQPGTANIDVSTTVQLPVGTRIDPGPTVQKLVVSGADSFPLGQQVKAEWVAGEKLVVKKFHDINRDGLFNHTDELIDWDVEICESGTDTCFTSQLGEGGSRVFALNPAKQYDVCEMTKVGWMATTPLCSENLDLPANVWFGNVEVPSLLIQKFHDLNGNAIQDADEPGIEGWPFQILRQNGDDFVSTYSGNTGIDGRLGYSNIDYHTYRADELFPSGETWYASTPASQTVAVNNNQTYTLTFGNLKPASLTVGKSWLVDSVAVTPSAGTAATVCIRRIGLGDVAVPIAPTVDGAELVPTGEGLYCYDQLVDTVTFDNLWPGTYELTEASPESWTPVSLSEQISLISGEATNSAGFVNSTTTAAIGDFVWFDWNQNGLQEQGERGVADVIVHLHNADGSTVGQTTTDSLGHYLFDKLPAGDYYVRFEIPADYLVSPINQTADGNPDSDLVDSDIDATTGQTEITTLLPGEFDMSWDAGIYKPTSPSFQFEKYINGNEADTINDAVSSERNQILTFRYEIVNDGDTSLVWSTLLDDVFGDLTQECGLPIEIAVGQTDACTISRLAGEFPNGKVNVGTVTLIEGTPPGLPPLQNPPLPPQSDPAWYVSLVPPSAQATPNPPATPTPTPPQPIPTQPTPIPPRPTPPPQPAELGDRVWIDQNQNGVQDQNEPAVPNIEVALLDGDGQPLGVTTVTDENGLYLFDGLTPGNYMVEFSIPYGYTLTVPFHGTNPFVDSNAELFDLYVARTPLVELSSGESDMSIDAGLILSPPVLTVNKVPDSNVVLPGELIMYAVEYANIGGSDALNVQITEVVPQHTTFDPDRSAAGWDCAGVAAGSVCTYNVGQVPANTSNSGSIQFVVRVSDPLPISVERIANLISIMDENNPNNPVGVGTPPVFVDIEQGILGTPPVAEPLPNQPNGTRLLPVIYLPLVE